MLYFILPMLVLASALRMLLFSQNSLTIPSFFLVLFNGIISDTVTITYFVLSIILITLALPIKIRTSRLGQIFLKSLLVLNICFWTWVCICEWFFWEEFQTRFNFIAVDYLIYTKEVIGNIRQSFSMEIILGVWLVISAILSIITLIVAKKYYRPHGKRQWKQGGLAALLIVPLYFIQDLPLIHSEDNLVNDLSKNGAYEFFSAFRNNELDYKKLYPNIDQNKMLNTIKEEFSKENILLTQDSENRFIKTPANTLNSNIKPNLIVITVESLGSKFIGSLGNQENITPYLNKLSDQSLFFTGVYATGTRTVRGLEALTLSLPPTPGASIVRRKNNDNLMSIGKVLSSQGYETKFIYGGHGIFDNMNAFFENNNYQIVDRTDFADDEITFSNVWGVADEDLFNKVLQESAKSYNDNKPFFSMVLTTSNHRPFTYPDGKIDIPSHTSRNGAVKYTDYAIGTFIERAQKQPWFDNTIIVVIADHSTEGRGVIDIPVETYHIPFWIYSPKYIKPRRVDTISSQIDMIPTILSTMNIKEPSLFFGRNILEMNKSDERFFVGTYQKVGFYSNGVFTSLGPKRTIESYEYDPLSKKLGKKIQSPENETKAISYYQYASYLYKNGLYKLK